MSVVTKALRQYTDIRGGGGALPEGRAAECEKSAGQSQMHHLETSHELREVEEGAQEAPIYHPPREAVEEEVQMGQKVPCLTVAALILGHCQLASVVERNNASHVEALVEQQKVCSEHSMLLWRDPESANMQRQSSVVSGSRGGGGGGALGRDAAALPEDGGGGGGGGTLGAEGARSSAEAFVRL